MILILELTPEKRKMMEMLRYIGFPLSKSSLQSFQGWFDGHPEIGKMQKDVFDDIFDTTDDDKTDEEDSVPVVPTPSDFQVPHRYEFDKMRNYNSSKTLIYPSLDVQINAHFVFP